jgi:hypothetical protein
MNQANLENLQSIHYHTGEEDLSPARAAAPVKIRWQPVSPEEEYRLREGDPRPIPDALAALILAPGGVASLTNRGITCESAQTGTVTYWAPDHPLCNGHASKGEKVVWILGTQAGDIVHLLDRRTKKYLGTLPAKNRPSPLDPEAMRAEYESHQRAIGRAASALETLHGRDSYQAVREAKENARALQKQLPRGGSHGLPGAPEEVPAEPAPLARLIADVEAGAARGRQLLETRRRSAADASAAHDRQAERCPDIPALAARPQLSYAADPFDVD